MKPREFFERKNCMTPNVISYGWIKDQEIAYELSTGKGFFGGTIFGVTVRGVEKKSYSKCGKKSECFDSIRKAEDYVMELQKSFKG